MRTTLLLVLAAACGSAAAQAPARNPMPDGSHDLYLGFGAQAAPRYEGSGERKVAALPVLQFEWSNGAFIAGPTAGMHLSSRPGLEYGPLLAIEPGRDASGKRGGPGGVDGSGIVPLARNHLEGMDEVGVRLQLGGFAHVRIAPGLRLTNTLLHGAGNARDGLAWRTGVQLAGTEVAPRHRLSATLGVTVVNGAWNRSFFGVTRLEAARSGNAEFSPAGGVKDVYAHVRWNWAMSPSWMLVSGVQLMRLTGDARRSPLTERPTNATVSTALAYRF